jgi:hypothetical protein
LQAVRKRLQPGRGRVPDLLAPLAAIISVVAAYLWFVGWVYAYFFYKDFGVGLISVDTPLQYFAVYSYTVLSAKSGIIVVLMVLLLFCLYDAGILPRALLIALLILALPVLRYRAEAIAHTDSQRLRGHPETIMRLAFKDPAAANTGAGRGEAISIPQLLTLEATEQLHLLVETKDRVVMYYQPAAVAPNAQSAAYIYTVMRSDLQWSMVIKQ